MLPMQLPFLISLAHPCSLISCVSCALRILHTCSPLPALMLRFLSSYRIPYDSYWTCGLLTHLCLPLLRRLPDHRSLLYMMTYSAMTCLFVLVFISLSWCLTLSMYISALVHALGTPSEFSSVPILVADKLASFPQLVHHDPKGSTLSPKSL